MISFPTGKVFLIGYPVSGRGGLNKFLHLIHLNPFKLPFDKDEEVTLVTFNKTRKQCRIVHLCQYGASFTVFQRNKGRFKIDLTKMQNSSISKSELEEILKEGTITAQEIL